MSREERRQYQRTVGRRAAGAYPTPPRRQQRNAPPGRPRQAPPASRAGEARFTGRFWTWTLGGALLIGLFVLSVSWDPATRSGTESLLYGALAAAAWLVGMVAYRLVRRRLQQRESG